MLGLSPTTRRRLKWIASRVDPRRTILFLTHWYWWVETPLYERTATLLRWKRRVRRLSRQEVDAYVPTHDPAEALDYPTRDNYRTLSYSGLNLWEVCRSSICDETLRPVPEFPADLDVIDHFFRNAARRIRAFERCFRAMRPRSIVVTQGFQYDMRSAVEVGRRLGIQTVAIENSFLRDYFFMDDSSGGIVNRHRLARNVWDTVRARALTVDQRDHVRSFLENAGTTFQHPDRSEGEDLRRELLIPADRRIVLLLAQVAVDAAVAMDSPIFEDQLVFMTRVAAILQRHAHTHHLVIRLHPKEATGTSHDGERRFDNMTLRRLLEAGLDKLAHVSVVHSKQANTYRLMDLSEFGVTLTSQTGLEMLARHKPVIVAGDAFYGRKGFTVDIAHADELRGAVERTIADPALTQEQRAGIDNFLYTMLFEYMYPKSLEGVETRLMDFFR